MKKALIILFSVALLMSCTKKAEPLEGTWLLESIVVEGVDYTNNDRMEEYYPDIDQSTIVFEGENQFTIKQVCMKANGSIPEFAYEYKGTYSCIDGEYQFIITESTNDDIEKDTITGTLQDNKLTLKKHYEAMGLWIVGNEKATDAYVTFAKQ